MKYFRAFGEFVYFLNRKPNTQSENINNAENTEIINNVENEIENFKRCVRRPRNISTEKPGLPKSEFKIMFVIQKKIRII